MARSFAPVLFIDIGATAAFFTLRETYLHRRHIPGEGAFGNAVVNGAYQGTVVEEERSFHHFNLSQDADEAWSKASEYAQRVGLPLVGSVDEIRTQLRDIQRATAEEMERRRQHHEQLRQERLAARAAEAQAWRAENADLVEWLNAHAECGDEFVRSLSASLKDWGSLTSGQTTAARAAMARSHQAAASRHVGQVGQRIKGARVRVVSSRLLSVISQYPRIERHVVKLEDEAGNIYAWFTSHGERPFDLFEPASFTVKDHDEYRGVKQTVVQRVAFKPQPETHPA